ncbi:MAG: DUF1501 domain-containing protein [Pseudomonadota bacterium]
MTNKTRRDFLRTCVGTACAGGILPHLLANTANAADTSGYKALVCLFFFGGIDNHDIIIPRDNASYQRFLNTRRSMMDIYAATPAAGSRARADLLPLLPNNSGVFGGLEYGLASEYEPVVDLFNSGELAVVGGVGPLIQPTTRDQFNARSVPLPKQLFSHNDQQSTWMALDTEGVRLGWGGRFIDQFRAADPSLRADLAGITTFGNTVFLSGTGDAPFALSRNGALPLTLVQNRNILGTSSDFDPVRQQINARLVSQNNASSNVFANDFETLQATGVGLTNEFGDAYAQRTPLTTTFTPGQAAGQLQVIAEAISLRNVLGVSRQVFFVGMGGFDTHSAQANSLPGLQTQIANGIRDFRNAMVELGVWDDVTLFTAADFGRTMNDNGDGTDHGWAGHHFVAGGSVRGQRVYGGFPDSDIASQDYTDDRGRLIPSVSVEQYAATLGSWFGLTDAELRSALPNLANFNSANLGFMQA